jgi:hypothetical protein
MTIGRALGKSPFPETNIETSNKREAQEPFSTQLGNVSNLLTSTRNQNAPLANFFCVEGYPFVFQTDLLALTWAPNRDLLRKVKGTKMPQP